MHYITPLLLDNKLVRYLRHLVDNHTVKLWVYSIMFVFILGFSIMLLNIKNQL
ncbi:MAG: hypothetical protein ABI543_04280 [Ignavibacteria bacterium]